MDKSKVVLTLSLDSLKSSSCLRLAQQWALWWSQLKIRKANWMGNWNGDGDVTNRADCVSTKRERNPNGSGDTYLREKASGACTWSGCVWENTRNQILCKKRSIHCSPRQTGTKERDAVLESDCCISTGRKITFYTNLWYAALLDTDSRVFCFSAVSVIEWGEVKLVKSALCQITSESRYITEHKGEKKG